MSLLILFGSGGDPGPTPEDPAIEYYYPASAPRVSTSRTYLAQGRNLTVTAYDTIGVDDCLTNLIEGTLHQKLTGEQLVEPVPREIKDWQIRLNLNI
jgi:hypothetical protein